MKALEVTINGQTIGICAEANFVAKVNSNGTHMHAQVTAKNESDESERWTWQLGDGMEGTVISFRLVEAAPGSGTPPTHFKPVDVKIDEIWKEHFENERRPNAWYGMAQTLKRGGDVIWEQWTQAAMLSGEESAESLDIHLDSTASLLYGFSMENLLKSCRLIKKLTLVKAGRPIKWGRGAHDLLELAKGLEKSLALCDGEKQLFHQLTAIIRWRGCYTTPKDLNEFLPEDHSGGEVAKREKKRRHLPFFPLNQIEKETFDRVFNRVREFAWNETYGRIRMVRNIQPRITQA